VFTEVGRRDMERRRKAKEAKDAEQLDAELINTIGGESSDLWSIVNDLPPEAEVKPSGVTVASGPVPDDSVGEGSSANGDAPTGEVSSEAAPISASDLNGLRLASAQLAEIYGADGDVRLRRLITVAEVHYFECGQLATLIASLSPGSQQVQAVNALRLRVLDPDQAYLLAEVLTEPEDKDAVMAMFQ